MITPLYVPVSNISIFPFVGYIDKPLKLIPDKLEVETIIEVSLEYLLNPKCIESETFYTNNIQITAPYYNINGNHVWGATAMILSEFLEIIKMSVKNYN
jgi:hypothetical protein